MKTSLKTPRAGNAKFPASRRKPQNKSILHYFTKSSDEPMFLDNGQLYSVSEEGDTGAISPGSPDRFNETESPVKKRRLSPERAGRTAVRKKIPNNPFVEDSSDEEGDGAPGKEEEPAHPPDGGTVCEEQGDEKCAEEQGAESAEEETIPPLKHDPSDASAERAELPDADFEFDDDFEGEESRERRYMEEQARLEDETACPICNTALSSLSPYEATAHVNACLDGQTDTPSNAPSEAPSDTPSDTPSHAVLQNSTQNTPALAPRPQANPIQLDTPSSAFAKLMAGHTEDSAWAAAASAESSSRGKPASRRTCPFYKIMPGLAICVDAFRYGAVEGCHAYFLSHFHSDHYIGLTAAWSHGPIYCSRVTASLVKSQLRTAARFVVELDYDCETVVPGTGASVTMIPANHCPGSSLFLFEKKTPTNTQRILHCGDFRACPAHIEHPCLRPDVLDAVSGRTRQQKIDVCYLDTTYLNPRYSFPPQDDVSSACADLCADLDRALAEGNDALWDSVVRRRAKSAAAAGTDSVSKFFSAEGSPSKTSPDDDPPSAFSVLGRKPPSRPRLLVVCGTYSIGKERICKAIAHALHSKIYAPPAKARIVAQLGDPDLAALLTADPADAQVHMQMLTEIRPDTLADYLASLRPHFARVVGFRPSGWNFRPEGITATANLPPASLPTPQLLHGRGWRPRLAAADMLPQRGSTRDALCFGAPYSEHSSFRELALFLMALRIDRVVPTVNVGSEIGRRRMKAWTDRWLAERRRGGLVRVEGGDDPSGTADGGSDETAPLWDGKDGRGGVVYW